MAEENENIETPLNLVISSDQGDDRSLAMSQKKSQDTRHVDTPEFSAASHRTADPPSRIPPAIPYNVSLYPSPMRKMLVKKVKVAPTAVEAVPENVAERSDSYSHITNRSILNVPSVSTGNYPPDVNMRSVPPMPSYIDQYNQIGAVKPLPHLNFEIKMKAFKNANSGAVSSDLAAKSKQIDKVIQKLKQKDHLKPNVKSQVKQEVKTVKTYNSESNSCAKDASVANTNTTNNLALSPKAKQIDSVIQKLKQLKEKSSSTTLETIAKLGKRKIEKVTCTKCDCSQEPKKKKVADPRNSLFTNTDQTVKKKLNLDTESVNVKKKQNKKENKIEQQTEKGGDVVVIVEAKQTSANIKSLKSEESSDCIKSKSSSVSLKPSKESLKTQKCKAGQKFSTVKETTPSSESNKLSKAVKTIEGPKSNKKKVVVGNQGIVKTKTESKDDENNMSKIVTNVKQSRKSEHRDDNKANIGMVLNETPLKDSKSSQESKHGVDKRSNIIERKPDLKRKQDAHNAKARVEESLLKIMMENDENLSKYKIPIAYRRVKRQASLNATAFVNILYEKQVPVPKPKETRDDSKRSKSESDLLKITKCIPVTSHSFTESPSKEDLHFEETFTSDETSADAVVDRACNTNNELKIPISKDDIKTHPQKVVTQDKNNVKTTKENKKKRVKSAKDEKASTSAKPSIKVKANANKKTKMTKNKSPENNVDKKKKSSLARMNKAKEITKTGKRQKAKQEVDYVPESSEIEEITDSEIDSDSEDEHKKKRKKREMCHAARTHVIVTRKQMYGEKLNWCDCCQMYYSDPGRTYWTNKELVDQGQKHSQGQPIQSSSADLSSTSLEVRPYTTQSHATIEGSPYMSQVMSHGHVPSCSSCGCALPGSQCRHYGHGAVGSMSGVQVRPCHPGYSGAYPVQYPLAGSYSHCGTCCSNGPYHATGAPLLHQPQLAMSADASILLRHPVPVQLSHDPSHPTHSLSLQMSHSEAGRQIPVQLQHSDTSIHCVHHMSHHCHTSPGEITNMSIGRNITLDALDHIPVDIDVCGDNDDDVVDSKSQIQILDDIPDDKTYATASVSTISGNMSETPSSFPTVANNQGSLESLDSFESANSREVSYSYIKTVTEDKSAINKNRNKRKITQSELQSEVLKKTSENDDDINKSQEIEKQNELNLKESSCLKTHKMSESSKTDKDRSKRKKSQAETAVDGKVAMKGVPVMWVGDGKGPGDKEKRAKKSVAFHGWQWHGQPEIRTMTQVFDGRSVKRKCYPAIRHEDGDIIQVKDCVLVCSGPRKVDIPYVAKVTSFWECPETLEMMMTVLWYYRPEHTEGGRQFFHMDSELFAAKHRDESLVACIDDKGYVLTQNEYCRFRAELARMKSYQLPRENIVPSQEEPYPSRRIPPLDVDPENVFICRHVYDFKLKRVLKNPT